MEEIYKKYKYYLLVLLLIVGYTVISNNISGRFSELSERIEDIEKREIILEYCLEYEVAWGTREAEDFYKTSCMDWVSQVTALDKPWSFDGWHESYREIRRDRKN